MESNTALRNCLLSLRAPSVRLRSVMSRIITRVAGRSPKSMRLPEISQGMLQAIYEYQTMICNLTGMDVANASMYDGASALAESCIMAANITKRKEILISSAVHPDYREVVKTYCKAHGFSLVEIELENGVTSVNKLKAKLTDSTAAFLVQSPNFFGCIENLESMEVVVHTRGALLNVCFSEAVSLGVLKNPGSFGADIVVGEGQSLGNPVNFGGPHLGIMATKQMYVRHLPGRIVGGTVDKGGNKGYILNLQTREQHIKRERATSNICSNEALCALSATVYLAALGKNGFRQVSEMCLQKAHYLAGSFSKAGVEIKFKNDFYNEFVVKVNDVKRVDSELLNEGMIGGLELGKYYTSFNDCLLFCVTELNTREEMDRLVEVVKGCN